MDHWWRKQPSDHLGSVVEAEPLTGGFAHDVWRVRLRDGTRLVLKASEHVTPDVFTIEADGLRTLSRQGGARTPEVVEAGPRHLLMEEMRPVPADDPRFWEEAGRMLARTHAAEPGTRFGWDGDGWLGLLRQHNPWSDDGYEFYAVHRILRYAAEPKAETALNAADRAGLDRVCERLRDLIPPAGSVLAHGDLWHANVVATSDGMPVFIDPAVHRTWAEADLSMAACIPGIPEGFFKAYEEIRPLEDGWRDRMPIYHLREHLCVLAHFGANAAEHTGHVEAIRRTLARFGG